MTPQWFRRAGGEAAPAEAAAAPPAVDVAAVTKVFAAPNWLRDVGLTAWLIVGVLIVILGAVWLLALTSTIVLPVLAAGIIASVAAPAVTWMRGRGVPRGAAAAVLMLAIVSVIVLMFVAVIGGITGQADAVQGHLGQATAKLAQGLEDLGVNPAKVNQTKSEASASTSEAFKTLVNGVAKGIEGISSLVLFLSFMVLSLFFMLKDGPTIRAWVERQVGIPPQVAHSIFDRVLQSMRGYFVGVTAIAAFNAVVVTLGAVALGVPMVGTIALVTFVGAYIPFLGAWAAGAFAVMIALGGAGEEAAIGMAVVCLLANGVLQQLVQPIAYGAALGIHPLAVLVVTIAGGCLFGTIGLVLAAPLTSAVVRIVGDMAAAREQEEAGPGDAAAEAAPA